MKQLKFKALTGAGEMLTREQMKNVLGGDNDYSTESDCSTTCSDGSTASISGCSGNCNCIPGESCTCGGGTKASCPRVLTPCECHG